MGTLLGILTDIHGDWATMQRVLNRLEDLAVDRIICLGDLVVHGPEPLAVVEWFLAHPEVISLLGNHDIGATIDEKQLSSIRFFSRDSYANTLLTRQALGAHHKAYLESLPLDHQEGPYTFTHAAMGNPFALLRSTEALAKAFACLPSPVLVAGHTHRTRVYHWPKGKGQWCSHQPVEGGKMVWDFDFGDRYIINVGCTAQLLYDPHPPICAVLEPERGRLSFHELPDLRTKPPQAKPYWLGSSGGPP